MDYFYVHIISYWPGNKRHDNIQQHIEFFKNYTLNNEQQLKKNLLIVSIRSDNLQPDSELENIIKAYDNSSQFKIQLLYNYNSGGTVKALYDVYKYLDNNNINYDYIACCEDDYCFKTYNFLNNAIEYLNQDYIFVGSLWNEDPHPTTTDGIKYGTNCLPSNRRIVPHLKYKHIYANTDTPNKIVSEKDYKWCEDPYITTYKNLQLIESKLKKFTLAPENEVYNYLEHGINYGEVGFPSRLAINNFKFIGIKKEKILQDLNIKKLH